MVIISVICLKSRQLQKIFKIDAYEIVEMRENFLVASKRFVFCKTFSDKSKNMRYKIHLVV